MSEDSSPDNRIEPRVKNVEQAIQLLTELALRSDERMDSFEAGLNNLTSKVEALADAQIRTETSLASLSEASARLTEASASLSEALTNLAEALAHTDQRLDALIDIVRGRNGNA